MFTKHIIRAKLSDEPFVKYILEAHPKYSNYNILSSPRKMDYYDHVDIICRPINGDKDYFIDVKRNSSNLADSINFSISYTDYNANFGNATSLAFIDETNKKIYLIDSFIIKYYIDNPIAGINKIKSCILLSKTCLAELCLKYTDNFHGIIDLSEEHIRVLQLLQDENLFDNF